MLRSIRPLLCAVNGPPTLKGAPSRELPAGAGVTSSEQQVAGCWLRMELALLHATWRAFAASSHKRISKVTVDINQLHQGHSPSGRTRQGTPHVLSRPPSPHCASAFGSSGLLWWWGWGAFAARPSQSTGPQHITLHVIHSLHSVRLPIRHGRLSKSSKLSARVVWMISFVVTSGAVHARTEKWGRTHDDGGCLGKGGSSRWPGAWLNAPCCPGHPGAYLARCPGSAGCQRPGPSRGRRTHPPRAAAAG